MPSPNRAIVVSPNRNTIGLAAVVLAMWYAGASQNNGAAYLLCFTLAALALVSAVHTWANLRGIEVRSGTISPVFAGETMLVPLRIAATSGRRSGIRVSAAGAVAAVHLDELAEEAPQTAQLCVEAGRRGCFPEIDLQCSSIFPMGFFTAHRRIIAPQTWYVYPKPAGELPLPEPYDPAHDREWGSRAEGDDFAGVRAWQRGDSMRHIDWKAAARGRELMVKQWRGSSGDIITLDWNSLEGLDEERRLSQLARWIVNAERRGATYGLRLPGAFLPPNRGETHFHECLRRLAAHS